jgi:3'(2'), 5'-bisphosphate nucleotidase
LPDVSDSLEIGANRAARLLDSLTDIVMRAAAATLAVPFESVERRLKDDRSPVTAADVASEAIITESISRLLPGVPIVAEESASQKIFGKLLPSFVIVDPLDGTREFLSGHDEFTVNIGIVTRGVPVVGIIAAPAQGQLWRGIVGGSAEKFNVRVENGHATVSNRKTIHSRTGVSQKALVAATSRSHIDPATEKFLGRLSIAEKYPCGSSVKFCHVAEGAADIYPRLAPTREWDIAAGCAILSAAGGVVTTTDGDELRFGGVADNFLVPGFIAWGDPVLARSTSK